MKQRLYVDADCGIGRMNNKAQRIPFTVDSLISEMNYYRVHASLVFSSVAKDYCFVKGNIELIDELKKSSRLFGLAAVIPDIQYELEEGYNYYDKLIKNGIKAFKLYPKTFRHGFNLFYLESITEYMIKNKIPLFVDIGEIDWKELRELLASCPELKVVLCGSTWAENRMLFPLMNRYENLYFDIHANHANYILDICKKHFGIDRILFGTNYPNKTIGCIKALVEYSDLSDADKDKISHMNILNLLNIKIDCIKPYAGDECKLDEIALKTDLGKPIDDVLIIDSHAHMVDKSHSTTSQVFMLNSDEDNIIRKMDRLGIDRVIISPWEGITTSGMNANKTLLEARNKYSKRIEAYATCNPHYEEDVSNVIEYHEKWRYIGIKPYHPKHQYDLLGDKYKKWFEYGNENNLIILIHSGSKEIAEKAGLLSEKYNNMAIILAHTGISYQVADWNIEIANKRENVYLEITYTSITNGIIEYLVEKAGTHKILFGTDMPMRDPAPQLAWVTYSKISIEDKKKILGENTLKLINRCYNISK